jgi:hypothetical protein
MRTAQRKILGTEELGFFGVIWLLWEFTLLPLFK